MAFIAFDLQRRRRYIRAAECSAMYVPATYRSDETGVSAFADQENP
jgi:hypothetical protein